MTPAESLTAITLGLAYFGAMLWAAKSGERRKLRVAYLERVGLLTTSDRWPDKAQARNQARLNAYCDKREGRRWRVLDGGSVRI